MEKVSEKFKAAWDLLEDADHAITSAGVAVASAYGRHSDAGKLVESALDVIKVAQATIQREVVNHRVQETAQGNR